jgi:transposase
MTGSQQQGTVVQRDFARELGLPEDACAINHRVWFQDCDGLRAVFIEQTPFYCYSLEDEVEHRFCAAQLVEAGLATSKRICEVFEISPRTFSRVRRQLRTGGIAALVGGTRGPKGRRGDTQAAGPLIARLYRKGASVSEIATQVGRSPSTIRRVLKDQGIDLKRRTTAGQGSLLADSADQQAAERASGDQQEASSLAVSSEPTTVALIEAEPDNIPINSSLSSVDASYQKASEQTSEPQQNEAAASEPLAVEATSIPYASPLDQFCAMFGLIEEAPVRFESTCDVRHAGVLIGLALLEETRLLAEARAVYGRLKNGWYGLRSLIWSLVVMGLLRIRRPEQIKNHDPASLGCVLGLPRSAEVKTIRRKLNEIAEHGQAAELHRRLAAQRAASDPSRLATLYVDGHVRAYHGRHRLGKLYASRLKKVVRGETDYWLHASDGQPLLVVHDPTNTSFTSVILQQVLPEIRPLIGQRRVRIVFDREGWSKELFHGLIEANLDFVTYRKSPYEPLPESSFRTVSVEQEDGQVSFELAEGRFSSEGWPSLRLIAVMKKNGGQTQIVATDRSTWEAEGKGTESLADYVDPPAVELAQTMFGRWRQENWLKYMREEYALDVLVDYATEADDPDRLVKNPQWRKLDRRIKQARESHRRAAAEYARLKAKQESASGEGDCKAQCGKCLACQQRKQWTEVQRRAEEVEALLRQRGATAKEVRLGDVDDRDPVKLSYERKLFTDTVKLSAFEIETRLYSMLEGVFRRREYEGRSLIRDILSAPGELRVRGNELEVHLEQLSTPRYTQALQSLCARLNALSPRLPETSMTLRFQVKPRPIG